MAWSSTAFRFGGILQGWSSIYWYTEGIARFAGTARLPLSLYLRGEGLVVLVVAAGDDDVVYFQHHAAELGGEEELLALGDEGVDDEVVAHV